MLSAETKVKDDNTYCDLDYSGSQKQYLHVTSFRRKQQIIFSWKSCIAYVTYRLVSYLLVDNFK